MMKMQWKAMPVAAMMCVLLSACDDDAKPDPAMPDAFIFGDYYGLCEGSNGCIDIYKLEAGKVYEDSKDKYPGGQPIYSGEYQLRSDINYDDIKSVIDKFPEQLLNETEITLGSPDFVDGGGFYVEIVRNNTRRYWLIDKIRIPADTYLMEFKAEMQAKLDLMEKDSKL